MCDSGAMAAESSRFSICVVDIQEERGRSAILYLLSMPGCVTTLLNDGADISIRDFNRRSILHYTCIKDRRQLLNALLSRSIR